MKTTARYVRDATLLAIALALARVDARARRRSRTLGIGRAATPDEIKKIDIDVMPDGRGLPEGKGTVAEGAKVYAAKCASCHGANGQGGSADRLVDRESGKNWDFATNAEAGEDRRQLLAVRDDALRLHRIARCRSCSRAR